MVNGDGIKTKLCKGCVTEKPFDEFRKYENKGRIYHLGYCKECEAWYQSHNIIRKLVNWGEYIYEDFVHNAF